MIVRALSYNNRRQETTSVVSYSFFTSSTVQHDHQHCSSQSGEILFGWPILTTFLASLLFSPSLPTSHTGEKARIVVEKER